MAFQSVLLDARGNEFAGQLDRIGGQTVTDARAASITLSSLNGEVVVDLDGHASVMVHLKTAAASMTFVAEGSVDGTNYILQPLPFLDLSTAACVASVVSTTTLDKAYVVPVSGMRRFRIRCSAFTSGTMGVAMRASLAPTPPISEMLYPTTLWVTATAAANTAATATLPAAPGLFHYITHIDITRNATAALAGTATIIHTTTNLSGTPAWSVGNAMVAGGTQVDVSHDYSCPLRSSTVNTATTVVAAAGGLAVLGRVNVGYYLGP
jgi:hypothetical protein